MLAGLANQLANIGLQAIEKSAGNGLTDLLGGLLKLGGSAVGGSATSLGPAAGFTSAASVAVTSVPLSVGGVFDAGARVRNFAVGGLIDRPTHFYSAGGETNLAGEMGTEAILPLKRMPNGDLGVSTGSPGSSGGGGVVVNAPITIQGGSSGGGSSVTPQQTAMMQAQLREAVRQAVVSAIADEKRAGGSLY